MHCAGCVLAWATLRGSRTWSWPECKPLNAVAAQLLATYISQPGCCEARADHAALAHTTARGWQCVLAPSTSAIVCPPGAAALPVLSTCNRLAYSSAHRRRHIAARNHANCAAPTPSVALVPGLQQMWPGWPWLSTAVNAVGRPCAGAHAHRRPG